MKRADTPCSCVAAMCTGHRTSLLGHGDDGWWEASNLDGRSSESRQVGNFRGLSCFAYLPRQYDSVETNLGIHRGLLLLEARILNLIADKIQVDQMDHSNHLRPPRQPATAPLLPADLMASLHAIGSTAKDLHRQLLEWRFRLPTIALGVGTQLRSLATWHECNILLEREVFGATRQDSAVQGSVDCILELCAEATSDKIEYLNSVRVASPLNACISDPSSFDRA